MEFLSKSTLVSQTDIVGDWFSPQMASKCSLIKFLLIDCYNGHIITIKLYLQYTVIQILHHGIQPCTLQTGTCWLSVIFFHWKWHCIYVFNLYVHLKFSKPKNSISFAMNMYMSKTNVTTCTTSTGLSNLFRKLLNLRI